MLEIKMTAIQQQLIKFRGLHVFSEDAASHQFDAAFSVALILSLEKHDVETKQAYINQNAHLIQLNNFQITDAELTPHLVEKFIRHIILRLNNQIQERNQAKLILEMNQAVNDELTWYNTISENNIIIAAGISVPPVDRVHVIAAVIPRGIDDIATIASRTVKVLAHFFSEAYGSLTDVRTGFSFANVGIQALAFLYFPFIYIYKGAIKKDYGVINTKNHVFWGISGVILVLTCITTFMPLTTAASACLISIFSIALAVSVYRIVSNYLDRRANRNEINSIKNNIPILQKSIANCERDIVFELSKQLSDPAVIKALHTKRINICTQLQAQLHQMREPQATRKELKNPLVRYGNIARVLVSTLTLVGAILFINAGPVTLPLGIGILAVAGACALVIFFAQQIKQYKLNREIEADKQQDKQLLLTSTTEIFKNLKVGFTENQSYLQSIALQVDSNDFARKRPLSPLFSSANDKHAYLLLNDDSSAGIALKAGKYT